MNLRIRMKGRVMLLGEVVRHVIGPTAIYWLSISKLIGPVVQVYESTQQMRCQCADLLAAPIGSGPNMWCQERDCMQGGSRDGHPPRYLYYLLFFTSLMGQCNTCNGTYRFGAYTWCQKETACKDDAEMDIHLDTCIIFFFSLPSWADATPATYMTKTTTCRIGDSEIRSPISPDHLKYTQWRYIIWIISTSKIVSQDFWTGMTKMISIYHQGWEFPWIWRAWLHTGRKYCLWWIKINCTVLYDGKEQLTNSYMRREFNHLLRRQIYLPSCN